MAKQQILTRLEVADGAGGMLPVVDLRFESVEWPVALRIPAEKAQLWMTYLDAECEARGYAHSSISQLDAAENSGTTQIRLASGTTAPAFDVVWERSRDDELLIRARPSGDPAPSIDDLQAFLTSVATALSEGRRKRQHRRAYFTFKGRSWSGDLWLTPDLCLGPPTKSAEDQNAPQIIVVDSMVEGVGSRGIADEFSRLLRELSIFLSVVVGIHVAEQRDSRVWIYEVDAAGHYTAFDLRGSAYYEPELYPQMPISGARPAIPTHAALRPGVGNAIAIALMGQRSVPEDTASLWRRLQSLPVGSRQQFLEAGNAFANAQLFWPDQRTSYASFLVVSCEALKPKSRRFDGANIYDVTNSLRGRPAADALRAVALNPQGIRSDHFHRGKVVDAELAPRFGTSYFNDPSFDDALRALNENSRICLVEWLICGGTYKFCWMPRPKLTWRDRLRRAAALLFNWR